MSSAHEEIWDEREERGIETVDRREVCKEGKCHAWKEQKPFYICHINHDTTYKENTNTVVYTGDNTAATSFSQCVLYKGIRERRVSSDLGEPEWCRR